MIRGLSEIKKFQHTFVATAMKITVQKLKMTSRK